MYLKLYWIIVVFPLCGCFSVISMHFNSLTTKRASLIAQLVNNKTTTTTTKTNLHAMQETQIQSLGLQIPQEKEIATHSSLLAWRIPRTEEETGGLLAMGSQRGGHH